MRSIIIIIILCIILSVQQISRAQLNFEGNPLTEDTEYKAEESHVSGGRNIRQDYQRFEVADGRTVSASRSPFTLSSAGDIITLNKQNLHAANATNKKEQVMRTTTKRSALEADRLLNITSSLDVSSKHIVKSSVNEPKILKDSSENRPRPSQPQSAVQITQAEARQLREYPVQPQRYLESYDSKPSQNSYKPLEQSKFHVSSDPTLRQQNANVPNSLISSSLNSPSSQALNKFLNSRTPEESHIALQHYLAIREQAARGLQGSSEPINGIQPAQNAPEQNNVHTEWVDSNKILNSHPNDEYLAYQRQENAYRQHLLSGVAPSKVVQDETVLTSYLPGQQVALPRGDNLEVQFRQNMSPFVGPGRQRPRYGGQVPGRFRGRPWAQSRIDPRPFGYHHKGPIYGGPPPPGFAGKWKPPVEVIYTRPPGFGHGPSPPSNPPVPYEDASQYFPDAEEAPPHKDVYYSQLYKQSYDPHYYNYIAKTGKIKPWLYGKLGKHEEKSIWWELFAGFKKHGMKNMFNPMFLLGMTIPTLTIMLSALVQKRSLGRSDSAGHITDEVLDELVQRIQQHIACYERQIKNEEGSKEKCW